MLNMLLEKKVEIGGEIVTYLSAGEGFLYALLGFAVTFFGIVILIAVIWAVGKIMNEVKKRDTAKKEEVSETSDVQEEGLPPEVKAAIVAAIAAYYAQEQSVCEFKVKRIRRL